MITEKELFEVIREEKYPTLALVCRKTNENKAFLNALLINLEQRGKIKRIDVGRSKVIEVVSE